MWKSLTEFTSGFIPTGEITEEKYPENGLLDVLNFEHGTTIGALQTRGKYDTLYSDFPLYSGLPARIKSWTVDKPSPKSLILIVMRSRNLLFASHDTEATNPSNATYWTFTAGGGTLVPNSDSFDLVTGHIGDKVTAPTASTKMTQVVTTNITEIRSRGFDTAIFSIYLKITSAANVTLRMTTNGTGGGTFTQTASVTTSWARYNVSHAIAADCTSITVEWQSTGTNALSFWGAQLEGCMAGNPIPTAYGESFNVQCPYSLWMRSRWDFTAQADANPNAWVDGWQNLTEVLYTDIQDYTATGNKIHLKNSSGYAPKKLTTFFNNYFNHWLVRKAGPNVADGANCYIGTSTYDGSTDCVVNGIGFTQYSWSGYKGHFIHKSWITTSGLFTSIGITDESIRIITAYDRVYTTFGNLIPPMVVQFIPSTSSNPFNSLLGQYNMFYADVLSKVGGLVSNTIGYDCIAQGSFSTTTTTGGTIANGFYYATLVLVLDNGIRIPEQASSFSITTGNNSVIIVATLTAIALTPRVTAVEVYVGNSASSNSQFLYATYYNTNVNWIDSGYYLKVTATLTTTPDSAAHTLLQNTARSNTIELRGSGKYLEYLGGRIYLGAPVESDDYLRFSSIRGITQEFCCFPFSQSDGYGFVAVEEGTSDTIRGIATTPDSDLAIFKGRGVYIYEVMSGSAGTRRLRQAFKGIGISSGKEGLLCKSPAGVFFADDNDVYLYSGGYSYPKRITQNKIRNYWNATYRTATYLKSVYNYQLNEYWIIANCSPMSSATYATILRYMVTTDSWSIMRFKTGLGPMWDIDEHDSLVPVALFSGSIIKIDINGATGLYDTCSVTTGKIKLDTDMKSSYLLGVKIKYVSDTTPVQIKVLLDNDAAVRSGMSATIPATTAGRVTEVERAFKYSAPAKYATIQVLPVTASTTIGRIDSLALDVIPVEPKEVRGK